MSIDIVGEGLLSAPDAKNGRLQRACLKLLKEHKANGSLPTNGRFLFYELEQAGVVPKQPHAPTFGNLGKRLRDAGNGFPYNLSFLLAIHAQTDQADLSPAHNNNRHRWLREYIALPPANMGGANMHNPLVLATALIGTSLLGACQQEA